mmetsp:Transcript_6369/g.16983  ORF Transcript_6369/g.16983 Transcript_6369/m.16983 type:complete len:290 (-) Transcript_6369:449-1318(-)
MSCLCRTVVHQPALSNTALKVTKINITSKSNLDPRSGQNPCLNLPGPSVFALSQKPAQSDATPLCRLLLPPSHSALEPACFPLAPSTAALCASFFAPALCAPCFAPASCAPFFALVSCVPIFAPASVTCFDELLFLSPLPFHWLPSACPALHSPRRCWMAANSSSVGSSRALRFLLLPGFELYFSASWSKNASACFARFSLICASALLPGNASCPLPPWLFLLLLLANGFEGCGRCATCFAQVENRLCFCTSPASMAAWMASMKRWESRSGSEHISHSNTLPMSPLNSE